MPTKKGPAAKTFSIKGPAGKLLREAFDKGTLPKGADTQVFSVAFKRFYAANIETLGFQPCNTSLKNAFRWFEKWEKGGATDGVRRGKWIH